MTQSVDTLRKFTVNNMKEYLSSIENLTKEVSPGYITVFRGQRDSTWKLIPSLLRQIKDPSIDWETLEEELVSRFKKMALPFVSQLPLTDVDWVALAQHHNLPTRLLDWSESPLIALFFALEKDPCKDSDGTVWIGRFRLAEAQTSDFDGLLDLVYFPTVTTLRMTSQRGCFSVHRLPTELEEFETLENRTEDTKYEFLRIDIPFQHKESMRSELASMGVDYLTIYPDLDGLSRKLATDIPKFRKESKRLYFF